MCLSFFTGSATSDNNESTFNYQDVILLMTTKTLLQHWHGRRVGQTFSDQLKTPSRDIMIYRARQYNILQEICNE